MQRRIDCIVKYSTQALAYLFVIYFLLHDCARNRLNISALKQAFMGSCDFTPSATAVVRRGIVIAMSVRPSFTFSTVSHSQSFWSFYFILHDLRFQVKISTILNSKWPTPKLSKTYFIKFSQDCALFLHELHTISFQRSKANISAKCRPSQIQNGRQRNRNKMHILILHWHCLHG